MSVGKRLKELRQSLNLTQKELAKELEVGVATIQRYERDEREPSSKFLEKLVQTYSVNPSWLLTGEGSMFKPPKVKETEMAKWEGYIPLPIKGEVGAGGYIIPIPPDEVEMYLVPDVGRIRPQKDWYVLKVVGKSMEPVIPDGAYIVVQPVDFGTIDSGQIVVLCEEEGEDIVGCTVKKVKDEGNKWLIIPLNGSYDAYTKPKEKVRIKGIVRRVIWDL